MNINAAYGIHSHLSMGISSTLQSPNYYLIEIHKWIRNTSFKCHVYYILYMHRGPVHNIKCVNVSFKNIMNPQQTIEHLIDLFNYYEYF